MSAPLVETVTCSTPVVGPAIPTGVESPHPAAASPNPPAMTGPGLAGASMIHFRMLGGLSLTAADGREVRSLLAQPRRLALLAYLAAGTPRDFQRRDSLVALFWPELDQKHARAALREAL